MTSAPTPPQPPVLRRRDHRFSRLDDRALRRAVKAERLTRITAGSFVHTDRWQALTPIERHRLRVREVVARSRGPVVISFFAAAAVHGIDILGPWPTTVDVTIDRAGGGRSSHEVRRHALGLEHLDLVRWGAHRLTSPAQTALDLVRTLPFMKGVCVLDQAISRARPQGPLTSIAQIAEMLDADPRRWGRAKARRVLEFADAGAANVRESQSRVVVAELGYPRPRTQEHRILPDGSDVYGDLYFPEYDHWCEIDGRGKYTDPEYTRGRTPAQIVIAEKNRENAIRRQVRGFSRWEALDADDPAKIWDILTADGMPRLRPRP